MVESSNMNNVTIPISKKKGRKPIPTGLVQRKDVVLKSLLRKIRAFYWLRFKTVTKFNEKKNREDALYFKQKVQEYVGIEFGIKPEDLFVDTLEAFIRLKSTDKDLVVIRD
mmetsp:Transcript_31788/g.28151  ORF Transcript_31788/g.28151 Transcript_31788/m.28151 type:complete len:111 (+) Transcript_31788:318-650(+)